MKYILYGHGGSYNHGGEAIIQTTCKMICSIDENATIVLSTHFKEQDEEFNLPVDRYCVRDTEAVEKEKADGNQNHYTGVVYKQLIEEIDKDAIVISVGGDNYCYDNWEKWTIIHSKAKSVGAKTVFWSCSIEPDMITTQMRDHLATFDLITAREVKTYDALIAAGLSNVKKCFDVAFLLEKQSVEIPEGFEEGNMVALNISPLVLRRESQSGMIKENVYECIDWILENTKMSVLLIPHVLMSVDNDVDALCGIKEHYKNSKRVILYNKNCSASQYKYLISLCRFGIFARTHASIAAYSSMIPSIVLGYSIKSAGIAKDLELEDYVLPIQELNNGILKERFQKLLQEEAVIKNRLIAKREMMLKDASVGADALRSLIER